MLVRVSVLFYELLFVFSSAASCSGHHETQGLLRSLLLGMIHQQMLPVKSIKMFVALSLTSNLISLIGLQLSSVHLAFVEISNHRTYLASSAAL